MLNEIGPVGTILIYAAAIALWIARRHWKFDQATVAASESPTKQSVPLENQLAVLADLGLVLNDGITIDDLLYTYGRQKYEQQPYDLLVEVFGIEVEREPWERVICSQVWNFDLECIEGPGSYVAIVTRIAEVAGRSDDLTNVSDTVDIEAKQASLTYSLNGSKREIEIVVDNDWADPEAISAIMSDLCDQNKRFYGMDNGQSIVLLHLDEQTATELNRLTADELKPL